MAKKPTKPHPRKKPARKISKALVRYKQQVKTSLSNQKLKTFKKFLIARKQFLLETLSQMEEESLTKSRREASGDLSNVPLHIADMGSDTFEQDFAIGLMESEGEEVHEIDNALERIENKTYGLCELCNKPIPEKRLRAIPYAHLCIKCKEKEESGA